MDFPCRESNNQKDLNHDFDDDIRHSFHHWEADVDLESSEKTINLVKEVKQSGFISSNMLSRLVGFVIKESWRGKVDTHREKKGMPVNITLAGG